MARREPVEKMTAEQLRGELVADAVKDVPTELRRFIRAITRIAELRRIDAEAAYQDVRNEVVALTGHGLPVA